MWKTIKSLTADKKNAQSVSCFKEGDCIIDDTEGMADLFNIHFASTAGSLRSTLPSANWNFNNLHNFVNSRKHPYVLFPVPTVTPSIVKTIFLSISPDQAVGIHCIRSHLLRIAAPEIVPSVARLRNIFIENGVFLKWWKKAKVTPLFKGGKTDDCSNFSLSVLPVLSKVVECYIHDCFYASLSENNLIWPWSV